MTTVKAEQNDQMIPMHTHADRPFTPKIVSAKKSGSGIMIIMTRSYGTKYQLYVCPAQRLAHAHRNTYKDNG